MLLLLAAAASAQCPVALTAAHLRIRAERARQGSPEDASMVLDEVGCLTEWADPALAAVVLSLGAYAGQTGEGWARTTTLPDFERCLWRADGVPLDGGVWQQPDGPSLIQRRCGDDLLRTWYLPDSVLPDEAYVPGALPDPTVSTLSLSMRPPPVVRPPLSAQQGRMQTLGIASLSLAATAGVFAVATRSWYRSGQGDADTLRIANGVLGAAAYGAGLTGAVVLVRLERERKRQEVSGLSPDRGR